MGRAMNYRKVVSTRYALAITVITLLAVMLGHMHTPVLVEGKSHLEVLIVGGGTSHDFAQNYQEIDSQTPKERG